MAKFLKVDGVEVSFVPAGHVLGSAQIVLEHGGERVVVSGDYKRRADPTCPPFVPVACDIFITEATFGLPSSDILTPAARSTGCSSACTRTPAAAFSSAPMRSARRSASSWSCAAAATATRSISTARSSG
jgi:hypothetical protein